MKKLLFFILLFFVGVTAAFAQVPANEQLTYQTVVRNAQNQLVFSQDNITVTVYVCNVDGTTVQYSETHTGLSTNANGLLSLMIGSVAPDQGTWDGIDWSTAYIKTTISYGSVTITSDPAPVTAVPYALSAGNMSNITNIIGDVIHDSIVNNISEQIHDSITDNISNQIHDSIMENMPDLSGYATLTGNNVFNGTNTVPRGFDINATDESNCNNVVVNACDLFAVFDSLNTRLNAVYDSLARLSQALEDLMNLVPPTANDTPKPCTAASRGTHNPQVAGTYTPAYGSDGLETVDASGDITSVKDIDNNEYKVVEIGSQCWMAVNLRTTKYADNTSITLGTTSNSSPIVGYYYDYSSGDPSIPLEQRGYLYNWPAAMKGTTTEGTQGVCPSGWHLPTETEWQTMVGQANASTETGAVYLSASRYWSGSTSGTGGMTPNSYDNPERNKSGFSAVPAGYFDSSFDGAGNYALFWSSSQGSSNDVLYRGLNYCYAGVGRETYYKNIGISVRCVRDYGPYTEDVTMTVTNDGGDTVNLCGESTKDVTFTATITGDDASDFTYSWSDGTSTTSKDTVALAAGTHTITVTATSSSHTLTASTSVTVSAGGTAVSIIFCEYEGVVSVVEDPQGSPNSIDWDDGQSSDGTVSTSTMHDYTTTLATGPHEVTITASNASGCTFSRTMTVTVLASGSTAADRTVKPCTVSGGAHQSSEYTGTGFEGANNGYETANGEGKITSVTDYDGNAYPVVQIGSQCWMAENLRTTHYANGDAVPAGTTSNSSPLNPYYYDFSSSSIPLVQRGYLYNWPAAMKSTTTEGTQGVCPKGWHVPTNDEWSSILEDVTNSGNAKLTTGCDWNSSDVSQEETTAKPGNYCYTKRNESGFSAVPAGKFNSSFDDAGDFAYFWSSTQSQNNSDNARCLALYYKIENVVRSTPNKSNGFSVRCVRDYGPYTEDVTMTVANDGGDTVNLCGESTKDVTFTATITGDDASDFTYSWSDGTSTTSKDTVALGDGTHTITVTATSSSHTLTASTSVTVSVGGTPISIGFCESEGIVSVKGEPQGSPNHLEWGDGQSFDGPVSESIEPHNYSTLGTGSHSVTITASNASGCSLSRTMTVTVLGSGSTAADRTVKPCTVSGGAHQGSEYTGTGFEGANNGYETANGEGKITSVTDYDGNAYPVVQIGSQCWMAENLRTTHYANGDAVPAGTTSNSSPLNPYYYDFSSSSIPLVQRGYLYNWPAAMKSTTTEGTQGVCPTGWHVPTDDEWTTMVAAAEADEGGPSGTGNAKLTTGCDWNSSGVEQDETTSKPGNYCYTKRNESGFSAVPAGFFDGSFDGAGYYANFWSSSQYSGHNAWYRCLRYPNAGVYLYDSRKNYGFSVRCVRDYGPYTEDVTMTVANDGGDTVNLCGESTKDVTFTATITGDNASDFTYAWSNGTSTTSKDTVALAEGPHTITVTATHITEGYTLTGTASVTIANGGEPISIGFCENEGIVSVKGNPQGSPNHLEWGDGGVFDGTVSESIEPHNYSTLGTGSHSVTITASNASGCSLSRTMTVTVLGSGSTAADRTVKPCDVGSHAAQTGSDYTGKGHSGANHGLETVNGSGKITSVTDYDGNEYPVVQIGSQCWLAENLRVSHSPKTGSNLVVTAVNSYGSKMAVWYNNDQSTYEAKRYGLLYNWCAAMDTANPGSSVTGGAGTYVEVADGSNNNNSFNFTPSGNHQGVCPIGWHVPTDEEWNEMELEVNGSDVPGSTGYSGSHAGKLSTGCDWVSKSTANVPGNYANAERNESGFSAVPASYFYNSFNSAGQNARFWSSTQSQNDSDNARYRGLNYAIAGVNRNSNYKVFGFSVRCVRDSVTVLGNDTPKPCTAASRGTHSPQVAGTYTPAHGSDGLETVDASGDITSVKDIDNNEYKVVEIGSQCWMAVNLRTTHYADNTPITLGTTNSSTTVGYYYDYSSVDPSIPLEQRGYLYNWPAAMKETTTEGTQGVCPSGWHLPTKTEWQTMVDQTDASTSTGAVYLSASCYWNGSNSATDGMTPNSYDNPDRNKSGFSAVPAGYFVGGSFYYSGYSAYFWSSSPDDSNAWTMDLNDSATYVNVNVSSRNIGISVRCVRD